MGEQRCRLTPEHFPLADLDQESLDRVLKPYDVDDVEDIYVLSPQQTGILFESLHRPGSGNYLPQMVYELCAGLDTRAFTSALTYVVERHDILRTTFVTDVAAHPVQVVRRNLPLPLRRIDWRNHTERDVDGLLDRLLDERRSLRFDLASEPPLWFDLIRVRHNRYLLAWHMHHILFDMASRDTMVDEMTAAYIGLVEHGTLPSRPEPAQYGDNVGWIRSRDAAGANRFWTDLLGDVVAPTAIEYVTAPVSDAPNATSTVLRAVPPAVVTGLVDLAQRSRCTLHTVAQGAWALVLNLYSGDADVCWGTVLSGRDSGEDGVSTLVGLLIDTVPVRVRVVGDRPVHEWLVALQSTLASVRSHAHIGLGEIRLASRVPAGSPLFETLFQFRLVDDEVPAPAGLFGSTVRGYEQTGYPIDFSVIRRNGNLAVQLRYEPMRLPSDRAEELLGAYVAVLEQLAAHPDGRLNDLDVVAEARRSSARRRAATAVPAPTDVPEVRRGERRPPATTVERLIAAAWCSVLRVDAVGLDDNFFELGGHSILSMRVASRLRREGLRISSADIFAHQTIAELAAVATVADPVEEDPATARPSPGRQAGSDAGERREHVRVTMSSDESAAFRAGVADADRLTAEELLLATVIPALSEWRQGGPVAIDVVSSTVVRMAVTPVEGESFGTYVAQVRDQARAVDLDAEIGFEYVPDPFDERPAGGPFVPTTTSSYRLGLTVGWSAGRLTLLWSFDPHHLEVSAVRALADRYYGALRRNIAQVATWDGAHRSTVEWLRRLYPRCPLVVGPMRRYRVPAVSVATIVGHDIVAWSHGVTSASGGTRVTERTRFQLGSVLKHHTVVALMRLRQDGKVDLDAPVNDHLTSWRVDVLAPDRPVTIRDLLGHRSGLQPVAPTGVAIAAKAPPGEYEYNATNYDVVEQLIADVTGLDFATALRRLVLEPLDLADTVLLPILPEDDRGEDIAYGHLASGRRYDADALPAWRDRITAWASASDVARLGMEVRAALESDSGRVLDQRSAVEMVAGLRNGYGLGTVVKTVGGSTWIGHPGDGPGFRTVFALEVGTGNGLVLLANGDGATPLIEDLLAELKIDLVMRVQGPLMVWDGVTAR